MVGTREGYAPDCPDDARRWSGMSRMDDRHIPRADSRTMAILEARDFGKRYGRRGSWALRHVDVTIPDESISALVGPNGSGKSTLLKSCIGFERPSEGHIQVAGVDPWSDLGSSLPKVGYVPQSPSLYRELTVADHLAMAASLRPTFDTTFARARLVDLDIPLASRAEQLSGGQQAQVGLAIALGTHAPLLLLDEPLASLDPLARREFLHVLVDAVREGGSTAVLSSHVITDIEQACDRLMVLGNGGVLLDLSIAGALAEHRVIGSGSPIDGGQVVGTFPGKDNERLDLVGGLVASEDPPGRAATLEEVVLGHLAAGRGGRAAVDVGEPQVAA